MELNGAKVDNGIYHLTLNDGVVDSRFMRIDFNKKIYVKEFADIDGALISTPDEGKEGGIRKLRIQELSGKGGIFRIYAKDKANHDVVVIDNSPEKTVNSFEIWNSIEDPTLGIDDRDPTTFVHVARAGKNVGFKDSILKKTEGSVWATQYTVRADEGNAWTKAQNAELDVSQGTTPDGVIWEHEGEQNWFITDWKRTGNPTYEDTAVNAFSIPYLYATQMERLQKRMGEARYSLGERTAPGCVCIMGAPIVLVLRTRIRWCRSAGIAVRIMMVQLQFMELRSTTSIRMRIMPTRFTGRPKWIVIA